MSRAAAAWRLPKVRGAALIVYRAVWVALAILTIPNLVYFPYQTERAQQKQELAWLRTGVQRVAGIDLRVSPSSAEARAKGVRLGDRLIAIDGRPVSGMGNMAVSGLLAGPDGSMVRIALQRDGQAPRTIVLTRDGRKVGEAYAGSGLSFASAHWSGFAAQQLGVIFALSAAIILFVRRPRDPVAGVLSIGLLMESAAPFTLWPSAPALLQQAFFVLTGVALLVAVLVFPSGRLTPRWTRWVAVAIAVSTPLLFLLFYVPWLYMPLSILYYALAVACLAAQVARFRAAPPGTIRQQLKFALLGFAVSIALAIVRLFSIWIERNVSGTAVAAWSYLFQDVASSLGDVALVAGLLVSLLRYRLYDADALISRSAAYAVLTVLIGAIFAGSEKVIEVLGEEFFGEGMKAVSAGLGAALAAMLIAPLHGRIHHWTEHRFQRALAGLKRDLPRLVGDMREVADLDHILATVVARIGHGVRASQLALLVRDEHGLQVARTASIDPAAVTEWRRGWQPRGGSGLECDRADALFPIRMPLTADGAGTVGWMLIGPRPDGSFYGKDEREAMAEVADPIARAIHIVRQRTAREAALEARLVRLEALLPRAIST